MTADLNHVPPEPAARAENLANEHERPFFVCQDYRVVAANAWLPRYGEIIRACYPVSWRYVPKCQRRLDDVNIQPS